MTTKAKPSARDLKRQQTRERLLAAAIVEFKRAGMVDADVGTIVAAAGVAHGTFFFHFPTKEHVLLELEKREEVRMEADFRGGLTDDSDLEHVLNHAVVVVKSLERRLGKRLFKDFLALHFSTSQPPEKNWVEHPFIVSVVEKIEAARVRGETNGRTDSMMHAVFFLLGLYALLITLPAAARSRDPVVEQYVATTLHGMVAP
ncbi:TetR/AcrR family transcriptional regulator [Nocardia sp. NPDC057455]|uniref:TetR/AcrR family transcriptional regulator n=1 Tax=Nocardia sp. NPDC057455 TaxID=3346138 RepID=UPI00366EA358